MGIFTNHDNCERRLVGYKVELNNFKNCLSKYEDLVKEYTGHIYENGNQIKEYEDSLQRYQNQLELYIEKYNHTINDNKTIIKESTLTMATKQDDIVKMLIATQKKNKKLKILIGFLLFLHLITISGIGFIVLFLLEII